MQAPLTTRVLSSPSSFSVQPFLCPVRWFCHSSGVSFSTQSATRLRSFFSEKCAPWTQQPGVGAARVDALAAAAEDAGPARGQPGEVGLDQVARIGGVDELDPLSREAERHLRHAAQPTWSQVTVRCRSRCRCCAAESVGPIVSSRATRRARPRLEHRAPAARRRALRRSAGAGVEAEDAAAPVRAPARRRQRRGCGGRAAHRLRQPGPGARRGQGRHGDHGVRHVGHPRGDQRRGGAARACAARPGSTSRCCPARTRPA